MTVHYNAFISYRHHPEDIRVAEEIHKALEHYHIPSALRKKVGKNLRLFRDKEELPITSNLSGDIRIALENSDFLIVICSTHTAESVWVQREIRLFLETHDRSRVLTVLVNGEPYEIIPDILLRDENGQDMEPLSCDWRQPRRTALREELPRLAAALLQCRYDDLRQREQRYRARKHLSILGTALAVCLVFMGYFLYSSLRIQENLMEALRNQSVYLSSESRRAMEEGDRMTAIALALEALTGESGDRPYVPQAAQALTNALGLYTVEAVPRVGGIFPVDSQVKDFEQGYDRDILYIAETSGKLTVWDSGTFRQLGQLQFGRIDSELQLTAGDNVVFLTGDRRLVCCNTEILWTMPEVSAFAFTGNGTEVLAIAYPDPSDREERPYVLHRLDAATGQPLAEPVELPGTEEAYPGFLRVNYGNRVVMELNGGEFDYGHPEKLKKNALVLDLDTGKTMVLGENLLLLSSAVVDAQGNVIVMASVDGSGMDNGVFYEMITTSAQNTDVICFDGTTGAERWRQTVTAYVTSAQERLYRVPDRDWILCCQGEMLAVFDSRTGEPVAKAYAPARILDVSPGAESASAYLENGYFFSFHYEEPLQNSLPVMAPSLYLVKRPFACTRDRKAVQVYRKPPVPEGEIVLRDAYLEDRVIQGSLMAGKNDGEILVVDCATGELLFRDSTGQLEAALGFTPGSLWAELDHGIASVNLSDGTVQPVELEKELLLSGFENRNRRMLGQDIFGLWKDGNTCGLMRFRTETGETAYWPLTEVGEGKNDIVAASQDYALVKLGAGLYELNMETGEVRILEEALEGPVFGESLDSLAAVSVGGRTELRRWGGDTEAVLDTEGETVISFRAEGGQLLALCGDNALRVYDRTGALLRQVQLNFGGSKITKDIFQDVPEWYRTEDGKLIILADSAIEVLDLETWGVEADVPVSWGYVPGEDGFLVPLRAEGQDVLKLVPRCSDLREKGREALNGYELPQERRAEYGLN